MRVMGHVFPITDFNHAIVSSLMLYLCQCLTQCPVESPAHVTAGLFVCSLLIDFTAETKRHVPEVITFVRSMIAAMSSVPHRIQITFKTDSVVQLRRIAASSTAPNANSISFKNFDSNELTFTEDFSIAVFNCILTLTSSLFQKYSTSVALPELLGPLVYELRALRPHDSPSLPHDYLIRHVDILETLIKSTESCAEDRVPLRWRPIKKATVEALNPRFDMNYTIRKDRDSDRDRAKLKQLSRQLKREKKSALREIRRDADFIDQERFKMETAKKQALRDERAKNFAWMEEQQATINQQVRKGKGLMKGGGTGVLKRPRIK